MIWASIRLSTELEFVAIILTSYIVANRSLIANPVTYVSSSTNIFSSTHPQAGDVPLGKTADKGHLQIMQKLLNAGANVNHQNKVMTIHSSFVMLNTDSACMMGLIGALSHK